MNGRALPLLPMGILLLLGVMTFWLSRFVEDEAVRTSANKRHDPDVLVEKFVAQKLSPAGDVQYVVSADKMAHYPDDDSSVLESIVFTATTPDRPTVIARAPIGRVIKGGDEIAMEGGVVVNADATGQSPAMQMRTPKLLLVPEKNLARSNDGVVIESVQGVMRASTFEFNSNTRELSLTRLKATLRSGKL